MQMTSVRPYPRLAGSARRRALIGLTPLIDVVFILLVFFMLASSFLDWRSIALAPPADAAMGGAMEGAILVELRQDGTVRLSGDPVRLNDLADRARIMAADRPDRRFVVRPVSGVPLQDAIAVLDRLNAAGIAQISLTR